MSYIYTVKPLKEAIKIAIEANQLVVNDDGTMSIFGIYGELWPAGIEVKCTARIVGDTFNNIGPYGFTVPLIYFTETKEQEPEYDAPGLSSKSDI